MREIPMMQTDIDITNKHFYNPRTGDHFQVRDVYNDGETFYIRTYDNRRISMNDVSNYIQSDTPIGKIPEVPVDMPKINLEGLDESASSEELKVQEEPTKNIDVSGLSVAEPVNIPQYTEKIPASKNEYILEKAMSKLNPPKVSISYNYSDEDKANTIKIISILKDMMDVPEDEIITYYYHTFIKNQLEIESKESFKGMFDTQNT